MPINISTSKRKVELEQEPKNILKQLKKFKPKKIIHFGSLSKGEAGLTSDIDLIIIMESQKPFHKRMIELYREIDYRDLCKSVNSHGADPIFPPPLRGEGRVGVIVNRPYLLEINRLIKSKEPPSPFPLPSREGEQRGAHRFLQRSLIMNRWIYWRILPRSLKGRWR